MNRQRLDAVNKLFSSRLPRRAALAQLTAGAAVGLLASAGFDGTRFQRAAAQTATPPAGASAYTVIRRYQLLPDASMEDLVERVNAGFVPIVSRIPGFQEYLFVDAGDGAHLTISLYDDPSGAEQSTRDAARLGGGECRRAHRGTAGGHRPAGCASTSMRIVRWRPPQRRNGWNLPG